MKQRYALLDGIRGLTLLSMMMYHTVWDLVFIFGADWEWYTGGAGYLWQQSICWTFILLSGFCWSFGKRKWKRGVTVFIGGMLITAVTVFVMPDDRVIFGVLTFLGSSALFMIPLEKLFRRCSPYVGLAVSALLFAVTRNVNIGYLGFERWNLFKLQESLYANLFTAYLGFPTPSFFSTDYFSIFPWIFLYITGYFFYRVLKEKGGNNVFSFIGKSRCTPVEWLGKHSFEIYMVHQPVIYGCLHIFTLMN